MRSPPVLARRQYSVLALALLGLSAVGLLSVAPVGRRAQATIDRCGVSSDLAPLDMNLPHVAQAPAAGKPVVIIAFGSSSTYGTGASTRDKTYPSRLAALLVRRLPGANISVLNRGVGGEAAATTLARVDSDVIAAHPASSSGRSASTTCCATSIRRRPARSSAKASRTCSGPASTWC
ncbi:MAG: SGNH/GDSL hydrolase family protein [Stellaceae bacterium]